MTTCVLYDNHFYFTSQDRADERDVSIYFEDDIILTSEQARLLLSDVTQSHRKRRKRKLDAPLSKRWQLPIAYTFDGQHS